MTISDRLATMCDIYHHIDLCVFAIFVMPLFPCLFTEAASLFAERFAEVRVWLVASGFPDTWPLTTNYSQNVHFFQNVNFTVNFITGYNYTDPEQIARFMAVMFRLRFWHFIILFFK